MKQVNIRDQLRHLHLMNPFFSFFRLIEAAYVAGEDEVTLTNAGKSFVVNLASLHEIRLDNFEIGNFSLVLLSKDSAYLGFNVTLSLGISKLRF